MCATVHDWVHAIGAHYDPNIPQINGKFQDFVDQYFITVCHQQDVLSFWHPAYISLCAIATILTPSCLQTNASNEE
jgi:hypothetical protein